MAFLRDVAIMPFCLFNREIARWNAPGPSCGLLIGTAASQKAACRPSCPCVVAGTLPAPEILILLGKASQEPNLLALGAGSWFKPTSLFHRGVIFNRVAGLNRAGLIGLGCLRDQA